MAFSRNAVGRRGILSSRRGYGGCCRRGPWLSWTSQPFNLSRGESIYSYTFISRKTSHPSSDWNSSATSGRGAPDQGQQSKGSQNWPESLEEVDPLQTLTTEPYVFNPSWGIIS